MLSLVLDILTSAQLQTPLPAIYSEMIDTAEHALPSYDYETRAIRLVSSLRSPIKSRKGYLCATFISWKESHLTVLISNMLKTRGFCNWFVAVYQSFSLTEQAMRLEIEDKILKKGISNSSFSVNSQPWFTVVPAPPKDKSPEHFYSICQGYCANYVDTASINFDQCKLIPPLHGLPYNPVLFSKAAMLMLLLRTLPYYEYVWTLDGDISLTSLDIDKFHLIHRCAFRKPPLVSQPLIHQPTQFYRYLYRRSWGHSSILANTVGFIELQAAMFHARFLEWFILAFIVPLLTTMYILGSDWGIDELYCTAARQYLATAVSHNATLTDPICAVIVGNMDVHHIDEKLIKRAMGGNDIHLHLNYAHMGIVRYYFPSFCSNGLLRENDPFVDNSSFIPSYGTARNCRVK
eukprot:gene5858-6451_t